MGRDGNAELEGERKINIIDVSKTMGEHTIL